MSVNFVFLSSLNLFLALILSLGIDNGKKSNITQHNITYTLGAFLWDDPDQDQ